MEWLAALLSLPLWLGIPVLLVGAVTRRSAVRIAFGVGLAVVLTFLWATAFDLLYIPGLPYGVEGMFLWGPTSLALCGAAFLTDRWVTRRRDPAVALPPHWTGRGLPWLLAAPIVAWSILCPGCAFSPVAELMDVRFSSPEPSLVLPLPTNLTLVSAERSCGSELCSDLYVISAPDEAGVEELSERLWTHLDSKGWQRRRGGAGCQRPGWFVRHEFCAYVRVDDTAPVAALRVHVTGA